MIKKFNEFISENLNSKLEIKFQDDDYSFVDDLFLDIDFSKISMGEWKKQYVYFKSLIVCPPCFGNPLLPKTKERRLKEGYSRTSIDIEDVKECICRQYELDDWQFNIKIYANDIKVGLIIPNIKNNELLIVEDMESLGYYVSSKGIMNINNMEYFYIRFDPKYPKDITEDVKNMKFIKHLTPKYNLESIKKHGFIPLNKNELFNYPPRIHFLKENIKEENIVFLGNQLSEYNTNIENDGTYVLLTLDVSKIPENVRFVGDSCYKYGICTEDSISYDTVIEIKEYKFKNS